VEPLYANDEYVCLCDNFRQTWNFRLRFWLSYTKWSISGQVRKRTNSDDLSRSRVSWFHINRQTFVSFIKHLRKFWKRLQDVYKTFTKVQKTFTERSKNVYRTFWKRSQNISNITTLITVGTLVSPLEYMRLERFITYSFIKKSRMRIPHCRGWEFPVGAICIAEYTRRHRELECGIKGGKEERARREDHSLLGMPSSSSIQHIIIFPFLVNLVFCDTILEVDSVLVIKHIIHYCIVWCLLIDCVSGSSYKVLIIHNSIQNIILISGI
jgi:hypothetical protein